MINYEKFLNDNAKKESYGTYAIVKYNGIKEATYFQHVWNDEYGLWFKPAPCSLYVIGECKNPYSEEWVEYFKELLEDGESVEDEESVEGYIEEYVKPMIMGDILYEIDHFQCMPYLPDEVDDIIIVSERKCLEWLVNHNSVKIQQILKSKGRGCI